MIKGSQYIKDWSELAKVPESPTHYLRIDVEGCNGWVIAKDHDPKQTGRFIYLTTHTFYDSCYRRSTKLLRERGFNVTLANWDAPGSTL